jgi:uncharacterized protein YndB with AHSA1/START domain
MAAKGTIDRRVRKRAGGGEDLVISRFFHVPRELVWRAWTDPGLTVRWWGPKVFTSPVSMIDLRVGGRYLICMRSPEGTDYWSTGVYREIVPLKRIVATDSFADEKGAVVPASHYGIPGKFPRELLVTVTFATRAAGTAMTLRHRGFPTKKMREQAGDGWNESFDKLETVLKAPGEILSVEARPGWPEIVISRTFDAPRELVFRAYTEGRLIERWWGPHRYTISVDRLEARNGGRWRFLQSEENGNEYAFHGVYHELRAPERIVGTFEFEGAPGHVSLDSLTLEDVGGRRTKVTSRSVFPSVEDRDAMLREGMIDEVAETMDRLAALLAQIQEGRKAA